MDLGAYARYDELDAVARENGIDVPRCRGYRLMADEEPLAGAEFDEALEETKFDVAESMARSWPPFALEPCCFEYSKAKDAYVRRHVEYGLVRVEDEDGGFETEKVVGIRWGAVRGKKRKNLKFAMKRKEKAFRAQWDAFNRHAGSEGVLYVHAKLGSASWSGVKWTDLKGEPWFIEGVDDACDPAYCDLYARISVER